MGFTQGYYIAKTLDQATNPNKGIFYCNPEFTRVADQNPTRSGCFGRNRIFEFPYLKKRSD